MTTLRPLRAALAVPLLLWASGARAEADSDLRASIEPAVVAEAAEPSPAEQPAASEPVAPVARARLVKAPLPPRRPAEFRLAALETSAAPAADQAAEAKPEPAIATPEPAAAAKAEPQPEAQIEASAPTDDAPTSAEEAAALVKQTDRVVTSCFPAELTAVLDRMSKHFGAPVIVTSGFRASGRRHSLHRSCKAADVQIAGVRPSQIIAFAKAQPEIGGIGAYRHTRSVHVDVREEKMSWFGRRGRGHVRVARSD